ncbi:hypothetical protein [Flavobacterium sp. TSSA_36]|uniref:hypothetical protein n=1 Tax=Flavobacterium sp. TSSA_36 TaxID=3447669 RepID=UPI003F2C4E81
MKKLLLLICTVFLFSCSSEENDSGSSSYYNPPAWIQGTWGEKADGNINITDEPLVKFTSDNFCLFVGGITTQCWKEVIQLTPQFMSGSDSHTDSTYEINLISGNGAETLTMNFKKVSATKIILVTSTGGRELDKLK